MPSPEELARQNIDKSLSLIANSAARGEARRRLDLVAGGANWPKERHLEQIAASGLFRLARELTCHGWEKVDARRVVGLAESIGGSPAIFGDRAPEVGETFERVRKTAARVLGDRTVPMLVCYRVRCGIRP